MVDNTGLYEQLSTLAEQNQTDIGTLIQQINELALTLDVEPGCYVQSLVSTITLLVDQQNFNDVINRWFSILEGVVLFDIGLLISCDHDEAKVYHTYFPSDPDLSQANMPIDAQMPIDVGTEPMLLELEADDISWLATDLRFSDSCYGMRIPIIKDSQLLGVVFLLSKGKPYTQSRLDKTIPFIQIIGQVFQNIHLTRAVYQNTDELALLYHATSILFQADSLSDFALQITEVVARTFDYADCGLMIIDWSSDKVIRVKRSGSEIVHSNRDLMIKGKGLVPKAIREGRLVYVPDVSLSSDYLVDDERILCELVVPLKTNQGLVGVLDFQSAKIDAFSERDQRIIMAFAERVAPALENVMLYDNLRNYMAELEQRVRQRTLELENTTEQLETILRNSPDAIVLLDWQGVIIRANLSWLSLVGKPIHKVIGQPFLSFLPKTVHSEFEEIFQQTIQDEIETDLAVEFFHQTSHQTVDVEVSLAPIVDERESGVVCNIRDMTHHKQSERMLREALQQTQELSNLKLSFVSMASHEFRTPLTTIMSSSDIVANYQAQLTPDKIVNHMQKIQNEVNYLNSLIDDILLLGRSGSERFRAKHQSVDLLRMIREIVGRVRKSDKYLHPIHVRLGKRARQTLTDVNLLSYILDNLLVNACKYSGAGKTVLLDIRLLDRLQIIVQDQGIGIPDQDMERLFDSFSRGSNVGNIRGTGIGLAIVQQALKALDGRIQVKSKVNHGTTITITIPVPTSTALE